MSAPKDDHGDDHGEDHGGLAPDEYARAVEILGRAPNAVELGIFAAMWSEHRSYKASRTWLKTLPVDSPRVRVGPGVGRAPLAMRGVVGPPSDPGRN